MAFHPKYSFLKLYSINMINCQFTKFWCSMTRFLRPPQKYIPLKGKCVLFHTPWVRTSSVLILSVQLLSRVWLFVTPMDCKTPSFPVLHHLPELAQLMLIDSKMSSNHLVLCRPLLFLHSVFPSIRVFSNESAVHSRWPKYWSFSFSISPSNEYLVLISLRIDWFDLLAVQGTLKSLL